MNLTGTKMVPLRLIETDTSGETMKRIDSIRHLQAHGCVLIREGGNLRVCHNPQANRTRTGPHDREVSARVANL